MAYQHLTVERAANVATLTLNRPDAYNALNLPLGRELFAGLRRNVLSAEQGACTWL